MTESKKVDFTNKDLILNSEEDTKKIAKLLAKYLIKGDRVFLYGDLGVGKTKFAQFLIQELTDNRKMSIISPTFPIYINYTINESQIELYHCDLYRLKNYKEWFHLGLEEYFDEGIFIIEWPELIEKHYPAHWGVYFSFNEGNENNNEGNKNDDLSEDNIDSSRKLFIKYLASSVS